MDLPFSSFEFAFIIIAFVVFTFFSLASVCFRPRAENDDCEARRLKLSRKKQRVITKQAEQRQ